MKIIAAYLAVLMCLIVLLPYFVTSCSAPSDNNINDKISLYNSVSKENELVDIEEYIVNVVCAEMPASFEPEALMAQAVAARTYALRKINSATPEHNGAQLCTNHAHCQAYNTHEELKEKWGSDYKKNYNKVKKAVYNTRGEYVSYNGEIAITVFHACSNGITEKSADVWGGDIPYLTNVSSPGDIQKSTYKSMVTVSLDEFVNKLNSYNDSEADLSKVPVGSVTQSSGGNVLDIELYGNNYKGTEVRNIFNLSSTAFSLTFSGNEFVFTVEGSGHGVGMSQYGANAMAKDGIKYKDIISHYYPGTEILNM